MSFDPHPFDEDAARPAAPAATQPVLDPSVDIEPTPQRRMPSGLSASSLSSYEQCAQRWKFEKIDRIPSDTGFTAVAGTHAHRVLELLMQERPAARTVERAIEIDDAVFAKLEARATLLRAAADDADPADVGEADDDDEHAADYVEAAADPSEFRTLVRNAVTGYFAMSDPRRVDVHSTEAFLSASLSTPDGDVPFRGIVDRIDRIPERFGGGLQPVDYKSGKVPDTKWGPDKNERQILLYAALVEAVYERLPRRGVLLYVTHSTPRIVEVTPARVDAAKAQAGAVWEDANARFEDDAYEPSPGPLCGWCPHVAICAPGEAEVRQRAAAGTEKGGLREDAPARKVFPDLPLVAA